MNQSLMAFFQEIKRFDIYLDLSRIKDETYFINLDDKQAQKHIRFYYLLT